MTPNLVPELPAKLVTLLKALYAARADVGPLFAAARDRHAALVPFGDALALFDALRIPKDDDERDAIVAALVAELDATQHPLWQALVCAEIDALARDARAMLESPRATDEDIEVLRSATEAAQTLPLDGVNLIGPEAVRIVIGHAIGVCFDALDADATEMEMPPIDDEVQWLGGHEPAPVGQTVALRIHHAAPRCEETSQTSRVRRVRRGWRQLRLKL
jgi:hypothetical protein